jgi:hypothetical protein
MIRSSRSYDLAEAGKQMAVEEAEKPKPEPKERTMLGLKLTEGLGIIEAGIKVFEKRAASKSCTRN